MVIKCVRRFRDLEAGTFRKEGDTFEVTEERYQAINTAGYGQLVEKVEETVPEAVSEPQKATPKPAKQTTRRRGRPKKTADADE